jgi:hypothetical protein
MEEANKREITTSEEHDDTDHSHPLPKGALVMILAYLILLSALWVQVYMLLLTSGGIPLR